MYWNFLDFSTLQNCGIFRFFTINLMFCSKSSSSSEIKIFYYEILYQRSERKKERNATKCSLSLKSGS